MVYLVPLTGSYNTSFQRRIGTRRRCVWEPNLGPTCTYSKV